ncbi:MAG TPA: hypothetical protein PK493_18870, partial [Pseudomonadota bacterium]|nr:hypothetical protein [Pseudomonadota bacterium]
MFGLGPTELIVILVLGLLVLGPERASLLHVLGHSDAALAVLTDLTTEEPEASDAYLSQAVLLYQLGRLDEALAALGRAQ